MQECFDCLALVLLGRKIAGLLAGRAFEEWDLLGVAKLSIRLVLYHTRFALDGNLKHASQWIGRRAGFVNLFNHRGTSSARSAAGAL